MTWFSNKALNRVYLHSAIQTFAETSGGAFLLVFLLKAGVPLPYVLCSLAAVNFGRYLLRPLVLPLARRIGLRNTLVCGTLLDSGSYWLVPCVDDLDWLLYVWIVVGAVGSVTYWTSYHAYVASTGNNEARGSQASVIEALAGLVSVIAPAMMTLLLVFSGPKLAFMTVALVQMAAALPLVGLPARPIEDAKPEPRILREGTLFFFVDGWAVALGYYLWSIALFVTLGEEFSTYGGTMVLAGIAGAAVSLCVGRMIDIGHGGRVAVLAYGAATLVVLGKTLAVGTPWMAMTMTAVAAMVAAVQVPVVMARLYNLAQDSGCTLRFNMATEGGWDLGSVTASLFAAALIAAGFSAQSVIWLAAPALLATGWMLRRSYDRDAGI
ncbi:MFS transporter [Parerythrobacter aurantius]|uniref:MFS transporter n=1 Tax=Parerythrobacter aurantius TaxID=3127706 RepID=UPI0032450B8D